MSHDSHYVTNHLSTSPTRFRDNVSFETSSSSDRLKRGDYILRQLSLEGVSCCNRPPRRLFRSCTPPTTPTSAQSARHPSRTLGITALTTATLHRHSGCDTRCNDTNWLLHGWIVPTVTMSALPSAPLRTARTPPHRTARSVTCIETATF